MIEKMTMKGLYCLLLLVIASLYACKEKKEQIINTGLFQVQLRSWSHLGEADFQVVYNNLPNTQFDRETLTIIKSYKRKEQLSADTLMVKISREQEDSIYYYAYKYLSNFKIGKKEDTSNGERLLQVYDDGGNYSVSLEEVDNRKLEVTKYRTAGIKQSEDEVNKLVSFINKQVPENFRIY